MLTVGIKTLKNQLSAYLRSAAAGETVLVTDRGRVIAELVAPRVRAGASLTEQRLGDLMRRGLMAPATGAPLAPLPARRPMTTLADVLRDVDLGRAER